ncbi:MAG: NUDIX domain-containing protein [Dongiaceae bacterium]
MTDADFELIEKATVFQGYFRIDRYRFRHRLFAGGWSGEISREVFERGHAVVVLPYDPERDAVVMLEQFRIGAAAAGEPMWQREVVAGIIDAGETPEAVAHREAREEAGCAIRDLVPIYHYLVSPGGTSETVRLFCGRVDSRGLGGIHGLPQEHEDIRVEIVPFAEARARLESGRIGNAPTIIALQWLVINHDALRARWLGPPSSAA